MKGNRAIFTDKEQNPMRGNRKRLAPTASTAGTCLSVVNIGNTPMPTVSRRVCWSLTVLWAVFQQISDRFKEKWVGGEKRKKGTGVTGRVNPNSHIPHLQVQLAFAWHNRAVLDRRMCTVSWYSRCSLPTVQG